MSKLPSIEELRETMIHGMGACLASVQLFELYASGCLLALFPDKKFGVEDLLSGDSSRRGPTLAALHQRMQKALPFEPTFETRLLRFVENRNIFIHRFFVPDIGSKQDDPEAALYAKLQFLLDLMNEAEALKPTFAGLYSILHRVQVMNGDVPGLSHFEAEAREMEKYEVHFLEATGRLRRTAQPGATDNPDDAQRLREDH